MILSNTPILKWRILVCPTGVFKGHKIYTGKLGKEVVENVNHDGLGVIIVELSDSKISTFAPNGSFYGSSFKVKVYENVLPMVPVLSVGYVVFNVGAVKNLCMI